MGGPWPLPPHQTSAVEDDDSLPENLTMA